MVEKIGCVSMDLQYYPGQDYYSDGVVEDEILEFVANNPHSEYDRFIKEKRSWAVLYHLSPIRENIVSSIDITEKDRVLEIGAGCGAITGKLCDMAQEVTCIELSKKRSMINANRNKDKKNLNIIVGNFETIEENLGEQYDVITMIGVYEYAASYIHSDNPYVDFIKIAMTHLKSDGKLIIAIENRLGMKYFAGCKEDHVGKFYEGLEGYTNTQGIATFTKDELISNLNQCGYSKVVFRYPYPDYKFPIQIYSDDYLPKEGDLNMNILNMDQERQILFDESKVYDSIVGTSLFPIFSNSYLLEVIK